MEKKKALICWGAAYFALVLLFLYLGWLLAIAAIIPVFIWLLIVLFYRWPKFRALCRYLEEKSRIPVYWIAGAAYYAFVLLFLCLGWLSTLAAIIPVFIPLLITSFYRWSKFRALSRYLEENHPAEWGRLAGRWMRSGNGLGADLFAFSKELDDDPKLREIKRDYKKLALFSYCLATIMVIFIFINIRY